MTDEAQAPESQLDKLVRLTVDLFRATKERQTAEAAYQTVADEIPEYQALITADNAYSKTVLAAMAFQNEMSENAPSIPDQRDALARVKAELGEEYADMMEAATDRLDAWESEQAEADMPEPAIAEEAGAQPNQFGN